MSDVNNGISRRSVLKGAAIGGAGLVAGGSLLAGCERSKSLEMFASQFVEI